MAAADVKTEETAATLPQPEFGPQAEGESNKRKAEPLDPPASNGQGDSAFAADSAAGGSPGRFSLVHDAHGKLESG